MTKMNKTLQLKSTLLLFVVLFFFKSVFAQNSFPQSLPFEKLSNYFVLHSIPSGKTQLIKITNQKEFDTYFGMGTTIGEGGKPSAIDFKSNFVLAIVYSYTNQLVDLIPVKINQIAKKKAQFQFQFKSRGSQKAISRPVTMIQLSNQYKKIKYELQQVK
jgi:hypothetical protein